MADKTNYFGHISGNLQELQNRLLHKTNSDLGAAEGRFFLNTTEDRMKLHNGVQYESVAFLSDLLGLSNWKAPIAAATTPAIGNIILANLQTIDDIVLVDGNKVLVKDQTDATENGYYAVVDGGSWTRIPEANSGAEIENSMCIVEAGTVNKGTIWKNTNVNPTLGVDDINFAPIILTVPTNDRRVWVSDTDTVEKTLSEAIQNSIVASGPAYTNQTNIKQVLLNLGANEKDSLGLDLTQYTGDTEFVGTHTQTGDILVTGQSTLEDLLINGNQTYGIGATIDYTNSTSTGTQEFDSNYIGNYTDSIINYDGAQTNYNNGSQLNQDDTSTMDLKGTTTYFDTAITNYNGTSNHQDGSIENYVDGAVVNQDGDINYGATSTQTYTAGATIGGSISQTNLTVTNTNVDVTNDSTSSITNNGNTISNNNTTENYTGVTQNYDAISSTTYEGDVIMNGDTTIDNLEVTNITLASGGSLVVNGAYSSEDHTFDGIETTHTLLVAPMDNNSVFIFVDGELPRLLGAGKDYTVSGNIVTFTYTPDAGTIMQFRYLKSSSIGTGLSSSGTVFISAPQTVTDGTVLTVTHNLNVSQADIVSGRYKLDVTMGDSGTPIGMVNNYNRVNNVQGATYTFTERTAADPSAPGISSRQANTLKLIITSIYGNPINVRVHIIDTFITNTSTTLSEGQVDAKISAAVSAAEGATVFVSSPYLVMNNNSTYTITHNLNVTQADVEACRYSVLFFYKGGSSYGAFKYNLDDSSSNVGFQKNIRSPTNPAFTSEMKRQENTLIVLVSNLGTYENARVVIKKNR